MPIYEYLCEACGTLTERMQKVSDPGPRKCPECGSRKIARLVSRTSFQLKGGGWYADLYASPKAADAKSGTHGGADGKPAADSRPGADPKDGAPAAPAPADAKAAPAPPAPAAEPARADRPARRSRRGKRP